MLAFSQKQQNGYKSAEVLKCEPSKLLSVDLKVFKNNNKNSRVPEIGTAVTVCFFAIIKQNKTMIYIP